MFYLTSTGVHVISMQQMLSFFIYEHFFLKKFGKTAVQPVLALLVFFHLSLLVCGRCFYAVSLIVSLFCVTFLRETKNIIKKQQEDISSLLIGSHCRGPKKNIKEKQSKTKLVEYYPYF